MTLPVSPLVPGGFPDIPPMPGVRFASIAAGLRYANRPDLALMVVDQGSVAAGVFTQSSTAGHPVIWSRQVLALGHGRAVIVNAGNANVFRTREGDEAVRAEAAAVAKALELDADQVFVSSTGVIGERLPVEAICRNVPSLASSLKPAAIEQAAKAIMTTDTFVKGSFAQGEIGGRPFTVAGIAKGSGMIAPDMATMLGFIFTDAAVPQPELQAMLQRCVDRSFNAITVDSDTSTSDTILLFATGKAGNRTDGDLSTVENALMLVCHDLALQIVRDGEGAQKLIAISVEGAIDDVSARKIAMSIANSPLVKTAIAGGDANWGRIIMAIGKSGEPVQSDAIGIAFGGHIVATQGSGLSDLDERPVAAHLAGRQIDISVRVGFGDGQARVWTCDLTHGYIDINADYRS